MYVNLERSNVKISSELRKKTKYIHDKIEERTGFQLSMNQTFEFIR